VLKLFLGVGVQFQVNAGAPACKRWTNVFGRTAVKQFEKFVAKSTASQAKRDTFANIPYALIIFKRLN
jgi:hypothetical protein